MSRLRHSHLLPMELYNPLSNGDYQSESIEAAWATEAIAFVYTSEMKGKTAIDLRIQISGDGHRWIDFGPKFETITQDGGYFLQLKHFGTFLRLAGELKGGPKNSPGAVLAFYWDFKE